MRKIGLWAVALFFGTVALYISGNMMHITAVAGISAAYADEGHRFGNRPNLPVPKWKEPNVAHAIPLCPTVSGAVNVKEGDPNGGKVQYWVNGFPNAANYCSYALELCVNGNSDDIGAKTFITTAEGVSILSSDNILNCGRGWSHFFDDAVVGAKEIIVGTSGGYSLRARFVGKPKFLQR
jgi:hypothetical protein